MKIITFMCRGWAQSLQMPAGQEVEVGGNETDTYLSRGYHPDSFSQEKYEQKLC